MTDMKLNKLNRGQLLEMLLEVSKENERLQEENNILKTELENRCIHNNTAGSIAEVAMEVNGVFQAAQAAADQYIESVKVLMENQQNELDGIREAHVQETMEMCTTIKNETVSKCKAMEAETRKKCEELEEETRRICEEKRQAATDKYSSLQAQIKALFENV